jgi:hypothetical protein
MPQDFCVTSPAEIYNNPPIPVSVNRTADSVIDARGVWSEFGELGLENLSVINGLTPNENVEMFRTPAIDRVIELLLTGLSRLPLVRRRLENSAI